MSGRPAVAASDARSTKAGLETAQELLRFCSGTAQVCSGFAQAKRTNRGGHGRRALLEDELPYLEEVTSHQAKLDGVDDVVVMKEAAEHMKAGHDLAWRKATAKG